MRRQTKSQSLRVRLRTSRRISRSFWMRSSRHRTSWMQPTSSARKKMRHGRLPMPRMLKQQTQDELDAADKLRKEENAAWKTTDAEDAEAADTGRVGCSRQAPQGRKCGMEDYRCRGCRGS